MNFTFNVLLECQGVIIDGNMAVGLADGEKG
jgi:hypothetical protein